jgi:hypothetical protein
MLRDSLADVSLIFRNPWVLLAGFALSRYKPDWPRRRRIACVTSLALLYAACVSLIFRQAIQGRPLLSLGAFVL